MRPATRSQYSGTVIVENTPPTRASAPSDWFPGVRCRGWLFASAPVNVGVTKVEFHLTGGSLNDALIATGASTTYGWLAVWNSTTVPDGTYTLQAEAYDGAGLQALSAGVTIVVENPPPTTSVVIPSSGASVSGARVTLDAGASQRGCDQGRVPSHGWIAERRAHRHGDSDLLRLARVWNSTTVPNGTYTLQSKATDRAGYEGVSTGVTVVVDNPPPTTSVLIPSNGASVSGARVILDAWASLNVGVTKVEFHLTGGSLNNALIATAPRPTYGWLASWDSTTVPNGTYTLQSEAYDPGGDVGASPPISVTVSN